MKATVAAAIEDRQKVVETLDASSLFRTHATFVARFLTRLGVRDRDLDDLVQEVFLVAHRRGGFVQGRARPTTWLAEIALRVSSTARRTERRRREELDESAVSQAASPHDPEARAETNERLARMRRALDALPVDKRAIFILFELEEESCDAIATGLGIPVGTVYSRLHAARREFLRAYEQAVKTGGRHPTGAVP